MQVVDKKAAKKATKKAGGKAFKGFTAEERAAMRERVEELKGKADGESAVLAKIAAMPGPDRAIGQRLHEARIDALVKKAVS